MNNTRVVGVAATAIVLFSLCAACASTSVSAAPAPHGIVGDPAASSPGANKINLFVRGSDGNIWWRHDERGAWGAWTSLSHPSGGATSSPTTTFDPYGHGSTVVYVRGGNGHIYLNIENSGHWSGWSTVSLLPYVIDANTNPAATNPFSAVQFAWIEGGNVAYWYAKQGVFHRGTLGHPSFGLTSSPSSAVTDTGVVSVKVKGPDGYCWYRQSYDGGKTWQGWTKLTGMPVYPIQAFSTPTTVRISPAALGTVILGSNNQAYFYSGVTGKWTPLSGSLSQGQSIAAVSHTPQTVDLFVRGDDGQLWSRWTQNAGAPSPSWHNWYVVA